MEVMGLEIPTLQLRRYLKVGYDENSTCNINVDELDYDGVPYLKNIRSVEKHSERRF